MLMIANRQTVYRIASAVAVVGVVGMSGCSGPADGASSGTVEPSDDPNGTGPARVLVCSTSTAVRPDGASQLVNEWYVPRAMNRKLLAYHDFAAFAATSQVTDCASARQVYSAYATYSATHPGFDAHQAASPVLDAPPPPPEVTLKIDLPETYKQQSGTGAANPPIVRLEDVQGSATGRASVFDCGTATFIAKNWLVTAAHNFKNPAGTGLNPTTTTPFWHHWAFAYADQNGNDIQGMTTDAPQTLTIPNPLYMGYNPMSPTADPYDLGLLYILPKYDNQLPVNASFSATSTDGTPPFMTLATDSNFLGGANETWWGYGDQLASPSNIYVANTVNGVPVNQLTQGPISAFQNGSPATNFPSELTDPGLVEGTVPGPPYAGPWACHGDSGGPVVDSVQVVGPPAVGTTQQQVVSAVFSFVSGSDLVYNAMYAQNGANGDPICYPAAKDVYHFVPVFPPQALTFIETTVAAWQIASASNAKNPHAGSVSDPTVGSCQYYAVSGSSTYVLWCDGDPCSNDNACCQSSTNYPNGTGYHDCESQRFYCKHPGSQLSNCFTSIGSNPICRGGACDCIQGSCLPAALPASASNSSTTNH